MSFVKGYNVTYFLACLVKNINLTRKPPRSWMLIQEIKCSQSALGTSVGAVHLLLYKGMIMLS